MTSAEILTQLKALGSESIKKVLVKHGAREPFYGVKVEELKKIQKKVKFDYKLSMELYDSGISDAMYLAGLMADSSRMTKKDIQHWADKAYWSMLSEYVVAWVASESQFAMELALEWIDSDRENIASSGWSTLGLYVAITPDEMLDIPQLRKLADRATKDIPKAPNRARHTMNGFLISLGAYVAPLTAHVLQLAAKIGKVEVDMGETTCKVPSITDYIQKIDSKGRIGQKRKMARC